MLSKLALLVTSYSNKRARFKKKVTSYSNKRVTITKTEVTSHMRAKIKKINKSNSTADAVQVEANLQE